jgi:integrase/recombinase XerD
MWERNWKGETAFFLNRHGDPVTATIVGKLVRDYAKKAGLEVTVTPHTLRHTFATHMVRHGADLTVVQKILGHTDLYVTQIYTHVAGVDVKKTHQETHPREIEVAHA